MSQQKPGTIQGNLNVLSIFEPILRHKERYLGRVAQVPKQFPNVLDDSDVVLPAVVPELAG